MLPQRDSFRRPQRTSTGPPSEFGRMDTPASRANARRAPASSTLAARDKRRRFRSNLDVRPIEGGALVNQQGRDLIGRMNDGRWATHGLGLPSPANVEGCSPTGTRSSPPPLLPFPPRVGPGIGPLLRKGVRSLAGQGLPHPAQSASTHEGGRGRCRARPAGCPCLREAYCPGVL